MKKLFLLLLMLAIPWQAFAAVERNLTHVLGSTTGMGYVIKHIAEHADHVLHHHDNDNHNDNDGDDIGTQIDNSEKSFQHLADFEHGNHVNIVLPVIYLPSLPAAARVAPAFRHDVFSDRTTRRIQPVLATPDY